MKTDMSPESITRRIRKTSELRRLCIALGGQRTKEKLKKMYPHHSTQGHGNYTEERRETFKNLSVDDIVKSIESKQME